LRAVFSFFPVNPWGHFQLDPGLRAPRKRPTMRELQNMKLLYFSSDASEVKGVSQEFTHAGIPCEIRNGHVPRGRSPEAEVWIRDDRDCHRAYLLCVQLGIGFAKRATAAAEIDWWS
jgi:hypothetical protein